MNFLACVPGRPVVSRMKGTRLMCGYLSNLFFSALLAISPGFVLAAETRNGLQEKGSNNRHIQIRDRTVKVKVNIHPSMFSLSLDNTGESRNLVFNEYLGATLRLNYIRKASPNSCMPAVNTSTVPTAVAVMLFRVHCFVADHTRRTLVWAQLYHICSVGGRRVREHQSSGY